jgi:hypothetical protein
MKQVIVGLVIGVIGFRLFNDWLATVPSSSADRQQRTYVDQLTSDDIEADVGVSEKLAAFLKDDTTIIGEYGSLEIEQVCRRTPQLDGFIQFISCFIIQYHF